MKTEKSCALNTNSPISFLDHISPLASLLNIPLIVTGEENALLTQRYYPEVKIRYMPDLEFRWKEVSEEFDTFFDCSSWLPHQRIFHRMMYQKEIRFIFCPHGQSDKGYDHSSLAHYGGEENILLYGDLMQEMLFELNLWNPEILHKKIGNFRFRYYQEHKDRLLATAETEIFSSLNSANPTLLYAPTWTDGDSAGTFFEYGEKLLNELPDHWNLLIKIHPLLPERDPGLFYRLSFLEERRSNFILVHQFPLIYPLLEKIDVYLGDYSSVGYDALAFQKPMFFLKRPHLSPVKLHTCGRILDPAKNFFQSIEEGLQTAHEFRSAQAELYQKAFAPH